MDTSDHTRDALSDLPFPPWNQFPTPPPDPPVITVLDLYLVMAIRHDGTPLGNMAHYAVTRLTMEAEA